MIRACAVAASLSVLSATTGQAATLWDAFMARCLAPAADITVPDTTGLTRSGGSWTSDQGWTLNFTSDRGGVVLCSVTATGTPEDRSAFQTWAGTAERDKTYMALPRHVLPDTAIAGLESYEWREPRIHVLVEQKKGLLRFTVEETQLESRALKIEGTPHA